MSRYVRKHRFTILGFAAPLFIVFVLATVGLSVFPKLPPRYRQCCGNLLGRVHLCRGGPSLSCLQSSRRNDPLGLPCFIPIRVIPDRVFDIEPLKPATEVMTRALRRLMPGEIELHQVDGLRQIIAHDPIGGKKYQGDHHSK